MILDQFPQVLWINLARSMDRRYAMEKLLNSYGLRHQRIEAIDGARSLVELETLCFPSPTLSRYETACTLSHLKAIHQFLQMPDSQVIVFEDDVSFEFLQYIPYDWTDLMKALPADWQVVQLAVSELEPTITLDLVKNIPGDGRYCSCAYLINKAGAQTIIDQYYHRAFNKYVLRHKFRPTADEIICYSAICYSIPIFSYQTNNSTIHDTHLAFHQISKDHQLNLWKLLTN